MNEQPRGVSPFADALRRARLHRSLTIGDVSRETLLSDRQIVGLENDDLSYFYTPAFAEKAAQSYAALLRVDPSLDGGPPYGRPGSAAITTSLIASPSIVKPPSTAWRLPLIGFTLICLSLAAYAGRTFWPSEPLAPRLAPPLAPKMTATAIVEPPLELSPPSMPPSVAPPVPAPVVAPEPVAPVVIPNAADLADAKANRFFLVITRQTTISARDGRGMLLLSGVQQPTSGKRVSGAPPFDIAIADDAAVEIYYLGNRVRPDRPPVAGITVSTLAP